MLHTYSVDAKLFEELFKELVPLYHQLQQCPTSSFFRFYQVQSVYFSINNDAERGSLLLFGTTAPIHFLTNTEVVEKEPVQPSIKLLPLTQQNFQILATKLLTEELTGVELVERQTQFRTTAKATPGEVAGFVDLVPGLEQLGGTKAVACCTGRYVSIMFKADDCLSCITFDDDEAYGTFSSAIFSCQIKELVVFGSDGLEKAAHLLGIQLKIATANDLKGKESKCSRELILKLEKMTKMDQIGALLSFLGTDFKSIKELNLSRYLQLQQVDSDQLELGKLLTKIKLHICSDSGRANLPIIFYRPLINQDEIIERQEFCKQIQPNIIIALKQTSGLHVCVNRILRKKDITRQAHDLFYLLESLSRILNLATRFVQLPEFAISQTDFVSELGVIENCIKKYIIPNQAVFSAFESQIVLINPNLDLKLVDLFNQLLQCNEQIQQHHNEVSNFLELDNAAHCKLQCTVQNKLSFKLPYFLNKQLEAATSKFDIQFAEKKQTGIKITTSKLRNLNQQFTDYYQQYVNASQLFVTELSYELLRFTPFLQQVENLVAHVDVLQALTAFGTKNRFTLPTFHNSRELIYRDVFNPNLVDSSFVQPNSFDITRELTFVTGANSGGKTQILKAIGVNQILAQLGALCAGNISTRPFRHVCLKFGSTDDLSKGLSTFMYEMQQVASALACADERSLVLVDELGRGTSQADGYGLSLAVAEALKERKATAVFVTHLHDVCTYFANKATFYTMRSEVAGGRLRLLYKIEPGTDDSHGIEIAQICGFSSDIIDEAKAWEAVRKIGGDGSGQVWEGAERALVRYQMGQIGKDELRRLISDQ